MKSLRGLVIVAVCALTGLQARGAIELTEAVERLPGVPPADAACPWEAEITPAAVAAAKGAVTLAANTPAAAGPKLSLQLLQLKRSNGAKDTEYEIVVRGNITDGGKLLATRDFQEEASFKNGPPVCNGLRALGATFGKNAAQWAAQTRLMECRDDCSGIHPDETIVVGAQILLADAEAINDTVRDDCRWPTAMVSRLVKAFNEDDLRPRAKLESRPIDIETYPGRRLVLRVKDVHALAGGGLSGPKWMTMAGELREGKLLVADFESHSTSGRGLTTCRSVDSLSDSTTSMIVEWLRSPTLGAKLK